MAKPNKNKAKGGGKETGNGMPIDTFCAWDGDVLVLAQNQGNRSAAARQLGVSRKTLERKLGSCGDGGED